MNGKGKTRSVVPRGHIVTILDANEVSARSADPKSVVQSATTRYSDVQLFALAIIG